MAIGTATLAGHRATHAVANIPAWGCWYADASIDGEHALTGSVDLKIADLTLRGTVLSGGVAKGRSSYRIVGGAGGWGGTLPKKSYANDAGVKLATVLGDAAREAGEALGAVSTTDRVGPAFVREEGPASRVLEALAPGAWYVGEDGVTRLGARAASTIPANVTRINAADLARGTVTLASESIVGILPGVVVDGLTAVDVQHEISLKGGLRSTVWGAQGGGSSRRLSAYRQIAAQIDPDRQFRGVTEYRVVTLEGERLNLQPVRVSTGMPDLRRVHPRPGVPGCSATAALGSRVLVGFIEADRGRPFVAAYEDPEGDGFQPTTLSMQAGGMAGGEHVMTTEAACLLIYNTLVAIMAAAGGGPLTALILQPLIGAAISAALAAQAIPAPPTAAAQIVAAAALQAGFAAGTTPSNAMFAAWTTAIAALSTKTANDSGSFPSVGSKAVKAG
jgi:hypothetical protein